MCNCRLYSITHVIILSTPIEKELWRYTDLLEVPKIITKDMTTFTKDPAPIEARREEMAEAIERLGGT